MKRLTFSRPTIRARLTLIYGGLFVIAGLLLLAVTYALVARRPPEANLTVAQPPPQGGGEPPGLSVSRIQDDTWKDALQALLTQGGIALAVVSAVAIGFGWLLAGRLLQPLQRVTETAQRIVDAPAADRGLHERISLPGPQDEVRQLADTFDTMLERLDRAFDGQRRFIANASHELRTPLTVNRALLEVALHRASVTPDVRQLGDTLLEVNSRQERLLDGLLLLARSERELDGMSYVDLADIVEHVTGQVESDAVTVSASPQEAPVMGNPELLERLVQNLVDNGLRHNVPAGGWVRISSSSRPNGAVVLEVSNTGPVVARYEIPGLFEPFRRSGDRRLCGAGAGLGLSIVLAIARAHDGEVSATPREGGGLTVTVALPGITA